MAEDTHHVGMGRWKVPAGSILIDIGLVLTLAYSAGQMNNAVQNLDRRLTVVEERAITPEADRRISVVEEAIKNASNDRTRMTIQLDRIEAKIDQHAAKAQARADK